MTELAPSPAPSADKSPGLFRRWFSRSKTTGADALAERLAEETGIDFREFRSAELGAELQEVVGAVWLLRAGISSTSLVFLTTGLIYFLTVLPLLNTALHATWTLVLAYLFSFLWFGLGAAYLALSGTLYVVARKLTGSISGLLSLFLQTTRGVAAAIREDGSDRRLLFSQLLTGVFSVVLMPLFLEVVKGKIPLVGGLVAGRIEGVLATGVLKVVLSDPEVVATDEALDAVSPGEDPKSHLETITGEVEKLASHVDAWNKKIRGLMLRPFLGTVALGLMVVYGPLAAIAAWAAWGSLG